MELPEVVGAVQVTVSLASPATATTFVGAPGVVPVPKGVIAALVDEAALVPTLLVAVTVKVYDTLELKFEMVHDVAVVVQVPPELEALGITDFRQLSRFPFRIIYGYQPEPAPVSYTHLTLPTNREV